jgi:hypothetical protein
MVAHGAAPVGGGGPSGGAPPGGGPSVGGAAACDDVGQDEIVEVIVGDDGASMADPFVDTRSSEGGGGSSSAGAAGEPSGRRTPRAETINRLISGASARVRSRADRRVDPADEAAGRRPPDSA